MKSLKLKLLENIEIVAVIGFLINCLLIFFISRRNDHISLVIKEHNYTLNQKLENVNVQYQQIHTFLDSSISSSFLTARLAASPDYIDKYSDTPGIPLQQDPNYLFEFDGYQKIHGIVLGAKNNVLKFTYIDDKKCNNWIQISDIDLEVIYWDDGSLKSPLSVTAKVDQGHLNCDVSSQTYLKKQYFNWEIKPKNTSVDSIVLVGILNQSNDPPINFILQGRIENSKIKCKVKWIVYPFDESLKQIINSDLIIEKTLNKKIGTW